MSGDSKLIVKFFATPAIDGNGSLYFGSQDGTFFAIDERSGLLKWKKETDYNFLFGSAAGNKFWACYNRWR